MKTLVKIIPVFALFFLGALAGCKKDTIGNIGSNQGEENSYMSVKMTESSIASDAASSSVGYDITSVHVDISSVEVLFTDVGVNEEKEKPGWVRLNTSEGVYDLLTLQNNIAATIASDTKLQAGNISQLRIILGSDNSVVISGDSQHTLSVPNKEIRMYLDTFLKEGKHLVLTLGFDALNSIKEEQNGTFTLKPIVTIKDVTSY